MYGSGSVCAASGCFAAYPKVQRRRSACMYRFMQSTSKDAILFHKKCSHCVRGLERYTARAMHIARLLFTFILLSNISYAQPLPAAHLDNFPGHPRVFVTSD